jgi:hypothetical protein
MPWPRNARPSHSLPREVPQDRRVHAWKGPIRWLRSRSIMLKMPAEEAVLP